MIRVVVAALALAVAALAAQADAWSSLKAWMGGEYCRLYASKCRPAALPPQRPVPPAAAPVAPAAKAVEAPPPAAAPAQAPAAPATPAAPARAPKAKPKAKAAAGDAGPDLPWPCWLVRFHAAGKSPAELERMGRERGVILTAKQRRQARACLR